MKASESIRKNRRDYVTRPPFALGGTVERPTVAVVLPNDQPMPGESTPSSGEGEDRQAESEQAR